MENAIAVPHQNLRRHEVQLMDRLAAEPLVQLGHRAVRQVH